VSIDKGGRAIVFNGPNAELILFYTYSIRAPYNDVQVASLDGQLRESVFSESWESSVPIFSPDGQRLFFYLYYPYNQTRSGLYFVAFAHPMPEFGLMTISLTGVMTITATTLVLYHRYFHMDSTRT